MPREHDLTIMTAEGVLFSYQLASPLTRFLAWAIDLVLVILAGSIANTIFGALQMISPDWSKALTMVVGFTIAIGYPIVWEWTQRGQTVGKQLLRLRVMDAQGLQLTLGQIVVRNLLRVVDALPALFLVGGLTALCTRRGQRLGDLAANTVVVRHAKARQPDFAQLLGGKFNSLRQHPHLAARLRQQLTPHHAALVLEALMRRNELQPEARIGLYRQLCTYLKQLVPFPAEACTGVSDEQYLRNVADIIYRDLPANR